MEKVMTPAWLEELVEENNQEMRRQIVQTVRRHCWQTGKRHQDVWHSVYHYFECDTGLSLHNCTGAKIAFVARKGRLGELLRAVSQVINDAPAFSKSTFSQTRR